MERELSKLEERTKELTPLQYRKELGYNQMTVQMQLDNLISVAERCGFVLTVNLADITPATPDKYISRIDLDAINPIPLGDFKMIGIVREARNIAK